MGIIVDNFASRGLVSSVSFTLDVAVNLLIVTGSYHLNSPPPAWVRYNGTDLTMAVDATFGGFAQSSIWYLQLPDTGSSYALTLSEALQLHTVECIAGKAGGNPVVHTAEVSNDNNDSVTINLSGGLVGDIGVFAGYKGGGTRVWTGLDATLETAGKGSGYEIGAAPAGSWGGSGDSHIIACGALFSAAKVGPKLFLSV